MAELEKEYESCQSTLASLRQSYRQTEDRMKNIEGQYSVLTELSKESGSSVNELPSQEPAGEVANEEPAEADKE